MKTDTLELQEHQRKKLSLIKRLADAFELQQGANLLIIQAMAHHLTATTRFLDKLGPVVRIVAASLDLLLALIFILPAAVQHARSKQAFGLTELAQCFSRINRAHRVKMAAGLLTVGLLILSVTLGYAAIFFAAIAIVGMVATIARTAFSHLERKLHLTTLTELRAQLAELEESDLKKNNFDEFIEKLATLKHQIEEAEGAYHKAHEEFIDNALEIFLSSLMLIGSAMAAVALFSPAAVFLILPANITIMSTIGIGLLYSLGKTIYKKFTDSTKAKTLRHNKKIKKQIKEEQRNRHQVTPQTVQGEGAKSTEEKSGTESPLPVNVHESETDIFSKLANNDKEKAIDIAKHIIENTLEEKTTSTSDPKAQKQEIANDSEKKIEDTLDIIEKKAEKQSMKSNKKDDDDGEGESDSGPKI